jgi:hypothetical protein
MLKTKREAEDASDRPVKSQKLDTESPIALSLDDVNDHCVLEIFNRLSVEELNSVAFFVSKRYYELRKSRLAGSDEDQNSHLHREYYPRFHP